VVCAGRIAQIHQGQHRQGCFATSPTVWLVIACNDVRGKYGCGTSLMSMGGMISGIVGVWESWYCNHWPTRRTYRLPQRARLQLIVSLREKTDTVGIMPGLSLCELKSSSRRVSGNSAELQKAETLLGSTQRPRRAARRPREETPATALGRGLPPIWALIRVTLNATSGLSFSAA
jgi:hypothetical protein